MFAPRNVGGIATMRTALRPQANAGAAAFTLLGLGIDRDAFQSALIKVVTGASSGAPTSFIVSAKLQDSEDNTTFADVVATQSNPAVALANVIAVNSSAFLEIDLSSLRRYIRVVFTVSFVGGTSPTILVAAEIELGGGPVLQVLHA